MKMRSLLLLGALCLLSTPGFAAPCVPNELTESSACLGQPCEDLGVSTMDSNKKSIIVCLKNDTGNLVWKSMSGTAALPTVPTCPVGSVLQYESGVFSCQILWKKMNYHHMYSACGNATNCSVQCMKGSMPFGGGCSYTPGTGCVIASQPLGVTSSGDGWQCTFCSGSKGVIVSAICGTIN